MKDQEISMAATKSIDNNQASYLDVCNYIDAFTKGAEWMQEQYKGLTPETVEQIVNTLKIIEGKTLSIGQLQEFRNLICNIDMELIK